MAYNGVSTVSKTIFGQVCFLCLHNLETPDTKCTLVFQHGVRAMHIPNRCPVGSTDQANPICFYFRIS